MNALTASEVRPHATALNDRHGISFNVQSVREAARGRWRDILRRLGIAVPPTPMQHGPCPACGGKDRFRFDDQNRRGTWFCNQCVPQAGDGVALVQNILRCEFREALDFIADEIGYQSSNGSQKRWIVAKYDYTDKAGKLLFQVVRFEPKDFRQRRPDGDGGWIWNLRDLEPVLYKLPQVMKATSVLIVEGEKDVETAYYLGLPDRWSATCNAMGAGKWRDSYSDCLAGKQVVILPDADEPGEKHAARIAQALLGKAASVQRLSLPDGAKDLSEWAVGRPRVELLALLEKAHPWSTAGTPWSTESDIWPEPLSLVAKVEAEPYPLDALPEGIRQAVEEVRTFTQAPVALVASSALAPLSLAVQAQIDVKRADRLTGPVSLFFLNIADSGERKSTNDGIFSERIRAYDLEQAERAKPDLQRYRAADAAWVAERDGVLTSIKHAAKSGKPLDDYKDRLAAIESRQPIPPRVPRLLHGDDTPEYLAHSLAHDWPSAGILTAEAGLIFGSHAMGPDSVMRNLALLNTLWDGGTHNVGRRTSESFNLRGARLTLGLQVQEATLRNFFDRSGGLARGTGFLARFLVSWPDSTQGFRPFKEPPDTWPWLDAYHRHISSILGATVSIDAEGGLNPAVMSLSPQAKVAWVAFYNEIEEKLRTGGELYDVRDVASKIADNAARLSALFQVYCSNCSSSTVPVEHMESACCIAAWHLNESRRFFGELALPTEVTDPARLEAWLIEYCRRQGITRVPTRTIQQYGPGKLRNRVPMLAATRELEKLHRLRLIDEKAIEVNPQLFIDKVEA